MSNDILVNSVKVINFAMRRALDSSVSQADIFNGQKKDYDTYVFNNVGFEVYDVTVLDWNTKESKFRYSLTPNQDISEDVELVPSIISFSAKPQNNV